MFETILLMLVVPTLIAFAASSDLLTMTISNWLSLALIALFPVAAVLAGLSMESILWGLAAGGVVLACGFALFVGGVIGGGDAKFAAAMAVWVGFSELLPYLLVVSVLGGALTFAILWMKWNPLPKLAMHMPWLARIQDPKTGIPYGIALSLGGLLILPQTPVWVAVFSTL
jgi:prepilin peptidase CpaA